jgi:hypothetical protein
VSPHSTIDLLQKTRYLRYSRAHFRLGFRQQGMCRDPRRALVGRFICRPVILSTVAIEICAQLSEMVVCALSRACRGAQLAKAIQGWRESIEAHSQAPNAEVLPTFVSPNVTRVTSLLQLTKRPGQRPLRFPEIRQYCESSAARRSSLDCLSIIERSSMQVNAHTHCDKTAACAYPRCPKLSAHVSSRFLQREGSYSISQEIAHG